MFGFLATKAAAFAGGLPAVLSSDASTNVLDTNTTTFVINAAKELLGLLTTPPLGTFLTIGILGAVVSLVGGIVALARRKH